MPNDYTEKIKAARDAGYNDDEIAAFIAKSDSKMSDALQQGYSGSEILQHLSKDNTAVPEKPWYETAWKNLKEGFAAPQQMQPGASEAGLRAVPRFAAPGATQTPLAPGISEAGAVANFGVRPTMGMPAPNMMGVAGDVASGLKEGTAVLSRTPTNELRPTLRAAAHIGPLVAGAEKGGVLGGLIGGTVGNQVETLLDRTLPKRTVAEQLKAPTSEAVKAPVSESEAAPPKPAGEGRPATWTNAKVIELAKQNNPDAIAQVKARKLDFAGSRYMTGEQMPSSPEYQGREGITHFDAEGKPITNAAAARTASEPTPEISRDSNGTKWAKVPGETSISIPDSMSDTEAIQYAKEKMKLQREVKARYGGSK